MIKVHFPRSQRSRCRHDGRAYSSFYQNYLVVCDILLYCSNYDPKLILRYIIYGKYEVIYIGRPTIKPTWPFNEHLYLAKSLVVGGVVTKDHKGRWSAYCSPLPLIPSLAWTLLPSLVPEAVLSSVSPGLTLISVTGSRNKG